MKVILLDELRGKGGEGDIIEVAQGYAENYLFPKGVAQPATPGNIKQLEERRHNIEKREEKRIGDAQSLKEQLDGRGVSVVAKVGDEGQLFGSVTTTQIAAAIAEQLGLEVDRKRIVLAQPIKMAGRHEVEINLYRDISSTVGVVVGGDEDVATAEDEATEASADDANAELEAESAEAEPAAE